MTRRRLAVVAALSTAAVAAVAAVTWFVARAVAPPASQLAFSNAGTDLRSGDVEAALKELAGRVRAVESEQAAAAASATLRRDEVTSLRTTTQDQALRVAGHEARVGALESRIAELAPVRTRLDYDDGAEATALDGDYAPLRDVGTFAKRHGPTALLLAWSTHIDAEGQPGSFCDFQLRIDGKPDTDVEGGAGRAVVYVPARARAASSPVSVSALFARVGAGSHTVSVWVRGSARSCQENYGNFPRSVLVEETPRG